MCKLIFLVIATCDKYSRAVRCVKCIHVKWSQAEQVKKLQETREKTGQGREQRQDRRDRLRRAKPKGVLVAECGCRSTDVLGHDVGGGFKDLEG